MQTFKFKTSSCRPNGKLKVIASFWKILLKSIFLTEPHVSHLWAIPINFPRRYSQDQLKVIKAHCYSKACLSLSVSTDKKPELSKSFRWNKQ